MTISEFPTSETDEYGIQSDEYDLEGIDDVVVLEEEGFTDTALSRLIESAPTKSEKFRVVLDYLFDDVLPDIASKHDKKVSELPRSIVAKSILKFLNRAIDVQNNEIENESTRRGIQARKLATLNALPAFAIARAILECESVCRVAPDAQREDEGQLCLYQDDGVFEGTYRSEERAIDRLIRQYAIEADIRLCKEVLNYLDSEAPTRAVTSVREHVAVGNGIVTFGADRKFDEFIPFSPEYVFRAKLATNYNPEATKSPKITMPDGLVWDFEEWLLDLANGDETMRDLLWVVIASVVRPRQGLDFMIMPFDRTGNNGKGTFVQLLRELIGDRNTAVLTINDLGEKFACEGLLGSYAILVDENDTGTYSKSAANLKAIVTHDKFRVERKNQTSVMYRYEGMMVQCLNEIPRFMDKSDSLQRRFLPIPFVKRFQGVERKYIKSEYMANPDVLEYVLNKALHMDLSDVPKDKNDPRIPAACRELMADMRRENDPLIEFFDDFEKGFLGYEDSVEEVSSIFWRNWEGNELRAETETARESGKVGPPALENFYVCRPMVYDLYLVWMKRNRPSASVLKAKEFNRQLGVILEDRPYWDFNYRPGTFKSWTFDVTWPMEGDKWMRGMIRQDNDPLLIWAKISYGYKGSAGEMRGIVSVAQPSMIEYAGPELSRIFYSKKAFDRATETSMRPRCLRLVPEKLPRYEAAEFSPSAEVSLEELFAEVGRESDGDISTGQDQAGGLPWDDCSPTVLRQIGGTTDEKESA